MFMINCLKIAGQVYIWDKEHLTGFIYWAIPSEEFQDFPDDPEAVKGGAPVAEKGSVGSTSGQEDTICHRATKPMHHSY